MAEDQAAGVPPAAETTILGLGAGEAGPAPAAALGMGMGQGGGGPPPAAAAAAAGQAHTVPRPLALVAASPGLGQGADVRVELGNGMYNNPPSRTMVDGGASFSPLPYPKVLRSSLPGANASRSVHVTLAAAPARVRTSSSH